MDLIITILPVVTKDLPISPRFTPYNFWSRCKFSTLTTRQPMVEFYLLTFPRFPLRKKEHKSYFGKNRTHDFRTSRCAGYLLDHSVSLLSVFPAKSGCSCQGTWHFFSCLALGKIRFPQGTFRWIPSSLGATFSFSAKDGCWYGKKERMLVLCITYCMWVTI